MFRSDAALSVYDFVHRVLDCADLIINVGHDVIKKPPFFMAAGGVQVIHVNFFSALVDPVYFPQVEVIGDIANSVWQLGQRNTKQPGWDFSRFMHIRETAEAHLGDGAGDSRFPVYPQRLVSNVRKMIPDDGIIALDNGIYNIWFARNYKARQPNTILLENALATMGAGLPSAMAARLPARSASSLQPDRQR